MTNSCLNCITKCKVFNDLSQIFANDARRLKLYYWFAEKCKEYKGEIK